MIAWRPIGLLLLALFGLAVITIATGMSTGGMAEFWPELRVPVLLFAALLVASFLLLLYMSVMRIRGRDQRDIKRYQLLLPQSDEATREELSAATDAVVQTRDVLLAHVLRAAVDGDRDMAHPADDRRGDRQEPAVLALRARDTRRGHERRAASRRTSRSGSAAPAMAPRWRMTRRSSRPSMCCACASRASGSCRSPRRKAAATDPTRGRSWPAPSATSRTSVASTGCRAYASASCPRTSVDRLAATRLRRMADQQKNTNAAISADVLEAQQGAAARCRSSSIRPPSSTRARHARRSPGSRNCRPFASACCQPGCRTAARTRSSNDRSSSASGCTGGGGRVRRRRCFPTRAAPRSSSPTSLPP